MDRLAQTRRTFMAGVAGAGALAALPGRTWAANTGFTITYPARAAVTWPLWIAQEKGFFARHGLDAKLIFGAHPAGIATVVSGEAQMTPYSVEQLLATAVRSPDLVIKSIPLLHAPFIMIGRPDVRTPAALKGKRIGISRLGDANYFYSLDVLAKAGLTAADVQWVPTGGDVAVRAKMLRNNMLDAAFLAVQHTFAMKEDGFVQIIDLADDSDIYMTLGNAFSRKWADKNPDVIERAIMAQSQATKFFYDNKAESIDIYRKYDEQPADILAKVYDIYAGNAHHERIPLATLPPLAFAARRMANDVPEIAKFDLRSIVDNSIVKKLIHAGFFADLYGDSVLKEQKAKLEAAI